MADKKKRPKKSSRRSPARASKGASSPRRFGLIFAALFLPAFLVACLLLLGYLRQSYGPRPPEPPAFDLSGSLAEDVRVEVESILFRAGVSRERIASSRRQEVLLFEVADERLPEQLAQELARRLKRISPQLYLAAANGGAGLQVRSQGGIIADIRFRPGPARPQDTVPPAKDSAARIAIVMDDLGRSLEQARSLISLDLPVTFAILPGTPFAAQVADLAARAGREVIVHIPMEPQGYPAVDPGADALLVRYPEQEIRRRVRAFFEAVPHAVGGNNHMGSRFTEDAQGMEAVLQVLEEQGRFFVDSVTSGRSVGFDLARRHGVPTAARDLFLDNEQDVKKIRAQIRKLIRRAETQGSAVGICHPYKETLEALRLEAGALRRAGVVVVPVSELLERS